MAEPKKKSFSFGTCTVNRTSPDKESLTADTKILNVVISFEDGLKLSMAIDECLRKLNSYNRNMKAGKNTGMNLAIHLEQKRITINEQRI